MRPDDAFWAARIVARFTDEMIGAVVQKAQYSDPRATEYMTQTLIARRDKVVAAWLNQVCPAVDPVLGADGAFTFTNAAVAARAAAPAESYQLQWFRFDNATATRTPVGERQTVAAPAGRAPAGLLDVGRVRRRRGDGASPAAPGVGAAGGVLLPPRRLGLDAGGRRARVKREAGPRKAGREESRRRARQKSQIAACRPPNGQISGLLKPLRGTTLVARGPHRTIELNVG